MNSKDQTKPTKQSDFSSENEEQKTVQQIETKKLKKRTKKWKGCYFASCS